MKKILYFCFIGLLAFVVASCKDDATPTVIPSDVADLKVDTENKPGFMVLRWTTPQDESIKYIQVNYFDYLLNKDVVRLASIYSDSILIPETRKKFGEYEFKVQTVSESNDRGTLQTVTAVSEPAPVQVVYGESKQVPLTAEQLSTNAQEPSEGPIAGLLDGNTGTFFHSAWSVSGTTDGGKQHWFQVDVQKELTYFKYESIARNGNNIPSDVDILGSADGEEFELITNLTKDKNGMQMSTTPYTSPIMGSSVKPYRYIRYVVNETNTNSLFFSMAEFKIFEVEASVYDPEAE